MTKFTITVEVDNLYDTLDIYGVILATACQNPGSAKIAFKANERKTVVISRDNLRISNGQSNAGTAPLHLVQ